MTNDKTAQAIRQAGRDWCETEGHERPGEGALAYEAGFLAAAALVQPVAGEGAKEKRAPVQGYTPGIPWSLHLEAYDAYCKRWGSQKALIDLEGRNCRGGFSTGELDMLVPGWRDRVSEIGALRAEVARLTALAATPHAARNEWKEAMLDEHLPGQDWPQDTPPSKIMKDIIAINVAAALDQAQAVQQPSEPAEKLSASDGIRAIRRRETPTSEILNFMVGGPAAAAQPPAQSSEPAQAVQQEDDPHPPSRHCACAFCSEYFKPDAQSPEPSPGVPVVVPVGELTDAGYILAIADQCTLTHVPEIAAHVERLRRITSRLATPQPAPAGAVPAGWKLMPLEPTLQMLEAGVKANEGDAVYKVMSTAGTERLEGALLEAYRAMLAASPSHAAGDKP